MTCEKLQFSLPAVFTIGPLDEIDSLRKYAKILTGKDAAHPTRQAATGRSHVQDIVKGIKSQLPGIMRIYVNRHLKASSREKPA